VNETLASLLSSRAAERPDHPFVSFPDGEVTYGELHERAAALARGLLAAGLKPGGHIGILMTNCVAYLELLFAIHLAGGVPVPFNARFRQRELAFVIAHSDIEVLVTTDLADEHTDFAGLLTQALPDLESQDDAQEDLHLVGAPKLRRIYLHGTKHAPPTPRAASSPTRPWSAAGPPTPNSSASSRTSRCGPRAPSSTWAASASPSPPWSAARRSCR
jgi:fatty-acyl-CoA synthase